jgi:hypothetical protein
MLSALDGAVYVERVATIRRRNPPGEKAVRRALRSRRKSSASRSWSAVTCPTNWVSRV